MNSLYLIPFVLILLFLLLISLIRNSASFLKSSLLLLFIMGVITAAFLGDKSTHVANAIGTITNWVKSPFFRTNDFLEEHFDMPIIKIKDNVLIDVQASSQFPELPRGCEVTSLSMLLSHAGVIVNKMELAEKVEKDLTPQSIKEGKIFYGNPNDGFVGNMYDFKKPGFGVYHQPIAELAQKYLPGKIKDLTSTDFEELKIHLSDGRPVWVIINTSYNSLPENLFQTWNTPTGEVKITYKEHSVLITGYDSQFIYFNDPLTGEKNKKAPIKAFEEAWVQMGRQAITYLP